MRQRIQQWIRDNEAISWGGLFVGILGTIASTWAVTQNLVGTVMLIVFGGLTTLLLIFMLVPDGSKDFPFYCLEDSMTWKLSGPRGKDGTVEEVFILKARTALATMVAFTGKADGPVTYEMWIRKLGKDRKPDPAGYIQITKDQVSKIPSAGGNDKFDYSIPLPISVEGGDLFELKTIAKVSDSFAKDAENVDKSVIHSTDMLRMTGSYSGCPIENVRIYKVQGDVPAGSKPISPTKADNTQTLVWEVGRVPRGVICRVSWRWA